MWAKSIIGHIGSESRHEYTAVGDAVSLTARLEDLTKTLGYPVVCSAAVAKAVENSGGLIDCGEQSVKGGRAPRVRLEPAAAGCELMPALWPKFIAWLKMDADAPDGGGLLCNCCGMPSPICACCASTR